MAGQKPKKGEMYTTIIVAEKDNEERKRLCVQHRYLWERGLHETRLDRTGKRAGHDA